MSFAALFLDMDHTLCDTARADEAGLLDLARHLEQEGLALKESENFARHFMELLYQNPEDFLRNPGEEEADYRGRLLQFALARHLALDFERCRELVLNLMAKRMEHYDFFSGVRDLLAQLRKNYKLIVITNGPLFSQQPKVDRVQLGDHVDHLVLAGALPWQKPDVRIFEFALQLEGLKPSQVCHIGDSLSSDVAGAMAAGIPCVWVNAEGLPCPKNLRPDGVIEKFVELPRVLEQRF